MPQAKNQFVYFLIAIDKIRNQILYHNQTSCQLMHLQERYTDKIHVLCPTTETFLHQLSFGQILIHQ